jgi:hypothetical protein
VTVTNHTAVDLVNVVVEGAGRQRPFGDVPAGSSVTRPFNVNTEVPALSGSFSSSVCANFGCWGPLGQATVRRPHARGVVSVSGVLITRAGVGHLRGDGPVTVVTMAPITLPEDPDPATIAAGVRVEALRPASTGTAAGATNGTGVVGGDSIGSVEPIPPVTALPEIQPDMTPTTLGVVGPAPVGGQGPFPWTVRIISLADRPAGTCAIHTVADDVEIWIDGAWRALPEVGAPRLSPRLSEPNEVQDHAVPAIGAGVPTYLRFVTQLDGIDPAMVVDCGEVP